VRALIGAKQGRGLTISAKKAIKRSNKYLGELPL